MQCIVKTVTGVQCLCPTSQKNSSFFGFLRFSSSSFVLVLRNWPGKQAFKTVGIEDTHLTLTGVLFQVGANNSLIFLQLQTPEKKFHYIPWLVYFNELYYKLTLRSWLLTSSLSVVRVLLSWTASSFFFCEVILYYYYNVTAYFDLQRQVYDEQ